MKAIFKNSAASAIVLSLVMAAPASAQLLGGSGGLGGGLGGTVNGTITRTTGTATGTATGSGRAEKKVDTRSGQVSGSGSAQGSGSGAIADGTDILGTPASGSASGAAEKSASGSADATLVGTDFVRATAADGVARGRGTVDSVRNTGSEAAGQASGLANSSIGSISGAGSIAGSGSGMAQGGLGQLAASGSAAASGAGMFAVEPGMPIEDAKGRVIGYVQQVHETKRGVVQAVTVEVGDRLATLPAANFAGSGDVLLTGMTKGELKSVAKEQQTAPASAAGSPSDSASDSMATEPAADSGSTQAPAENTSAPRGSANERQHSGQQPK